MPTHQWSCVYKGRPDIYSAHGHAAASWDTFDRREWISGRYKLTLTRPRSNTYTLIISKDGVPVRAILGKNHLAICNRAREWVEGN